MLSLSNLTQAVTNGSTQLMNTGRQAVNSTTQKAQRLSQGWMHNFHQNPAKQMLLSSVLVGGVAVSAACYGYGAKFLMKTGESLAGYSPEEDPNLIYINDLAYNTVSTVVGLASSYLFLDRSIVIFNVPAPPMPAPVAVPVLPTGP